MIPGAERGLRAPRHVLRGPGMCPQRADASGRAGTRQLGGSLAIELVEVYINYQYFSPTDEICRMHVPPENVPVVHVLATPNKV